MIQAIGGFLLHVLYVFLFAVALWGVHRLANLDRFKGVSGSYKGTKAVFSKENWNLIYPWVAGVLWLAFSYYIFFGK